MIDEFDLKGSFIRSFDLPKEMRFASLVGIRDDGLILMSATNFGTVGALVYTMEMGDSLSVKEKITIIETQDEDYTRATTRGGIKMREQEFIYSFDSKYAHQIYSYDGNRKLEVQRKFDGVLGPGVYTDGNSVSIYGLGNVGSPVILDDGYYLVNVRYPTNIDDPHAYAKRASTGKAESPIYEELLDVYNSDHELLYIFNDTDFVESLGSLSTRDEQGYYYSAFSDELQIKKYKIVSE